MKHLKHYETPETAETLKRQGVRQAIAIIKCFNTFEAPETAETV